MCDERTFGHDSFVCVCDSEYCDEINDVPPPPKGSFTRVISSRDKYRFIIQTDNESSHSDGVILNVEYENEYQTINGFGGAFTDAMGITVTSLSSGAQENLLKSYFSKTGIGYNLCRIPIAGTDFSTHPYSYDEVENDVDLKHFALTKEDWTYKIPLIKRAEEMSESGIKFFGSPWSPPAWMKENKKHNGKGGLLKEMWDPYSNYLIKFIQEYKKNEINIWGITTVNEPLAGFQDWPWNACAWSATDMRDWIKSSFGPKMKNSGLDEVKIMFYEHSRKELLSYTNTVLEDEEARGYIDGVAIHWYDDLEGHGPEILSELHGKFQDKFLLYTEACEGFDSKPEEKVQLGSWGRAESYTNNIIDDLNNFVTGWVDWNMALNMDGGPNWAGNSVDAPIIINKENDEFYKQPMFYALGHFSKFISRGSKVLQTKIPEEMNGLKMTALVHHSNERYILVILNRSIIEQKISIRTPAGKYLNLLLNSKSIETVIFKKE